MSTTASYWEHDHLVSFLFFPYILFAFITYYIVVLLLSFYLFDQKVYFNQYSEHQRSDQSEGCEPGGMTCYRPWIFPLLRFETVFEGVYSGIATIFLTLVRVEAYVYIAMYTIERYNDDTDYHWMHLETWTSLVALAHFMVVGFCSIWTIIYWMPRLISIHRWRIRYPVWPLWVERLGTIALALRSVAMINCIYLIILQLAYKDSYGEYSDRLSLAPAASLFVECLLSKLPLRLEHYLYPLAAILVYWIALWIGVFFDKFSWPAPHLSLDTVRCFQHYAVLLGYHLAVFIACVGVNALKERIFQLNYKDLYYEPQLAYSMVKSDHLNRREGHEEEEEEGAAAAENGEWVTVTQTIGHMGTDDEEAGRGLFEGSHRGRRSSERTTLSRRVNAEQSGAGQNGALQTVEETIGV
eukprot:scaffold978_cov172-Ochromonas_danica.AAC.4